MLIKHAKYATGVLGMVVALGAGLAVGPVGTAQAALLIGGSSPGIQVDGSSNSDIIAIAGGLLPISDVDVLINFTKCDDPIIGAACAGGGFSFNGEIVFRLTSPGGTIVNLVNAGTYTGQTPGANVAVVFDDAAASVVGGPILLSGTFRPVGSLSAFNSESANGNWSLFVQDTVGLDPLRLNAWRLSINTAAVPEPATLTLFGLGLAGLGLARRRKQKAA